MTFDTVDQILDFAIQKEQEAHDLYRDLADKVRRPGMGAMFNELADMEAGHRARLERIKAGDRPVMADEQVADLRVADYLKDVQPEPNMDYQSALLFAIKAEQRAHDLYMGLAGATDDAGLKDVFKGLAQEELKHKLRFETEYDDVVLEGN